MKASGPALGVSGGAQPYSANLATLATTTPGATGLAVLATATAAEARTAIGVTPLGSTLQALDTLLSGASQPNNDCWSPVRRTDGAWEWQPRMYVPGRRCQMFSANNASATNILFGYESTQSAAGTQASIAATVGSFTRRYVRYTCTATTGQQAGVSPGGVGTVGFPLQTLQLLGYGFRWPTDIAAVRVRIGASASSNNVVWAASTPPNNTLDIRYDPGAGDTAAMLSSKDTTTALTAAFDVARVPVAGDWWDLAFSLAPGGTSVQVWVAVNGGVWTLVATRSTSLPVAATGMFLHAGVETRENVAKNIGIGSCYAVAT